MLNKVNLIGRLGKDPEVRHFDNDGSVCNFTIATTERYKGKDGNRVEQTEWHNVAIWQKGLVGVAEKYLKKGSLVHLEGKLRTRSWEDKQNVKRYMTEIIVDKMIMLDTKNSAEKTKNTESNSSSEDIADDLPF